MTLIAELENRAMALSQQGDTQATIRVCREILAIDRNHLSSLRFLADMAIASGDFSATANYLTTLLENSPGDLQALPARTGALSSRQTGAGDRGLHGLLAH